MEFLEFGPGTGGLIFLGVLAGLALIDSTSFGTLLIPVWLLAAPGRLRVGRMLVYLATIVTFYFSLGLLILWGAEAFFRQFGSALESTPALVAQLLLGATLFAVSFAIDSRKAKARAAERATNGGGRLNKWRTQAMGQPRADSQTMNRDGSLLGLMGLALTAAAIEVASMLPYLAAIGIITSQGPGWPTSALLILGYCMVMVAPALLLMVARIVASRALDKPLRRLDDWLTRNAASTTAWIVGIVGALLAVNAAGGLDLI
jgi:cytochrome c biogenesis protein CcdA